MAVRGVGGRDWVGLGMERHGGVTGRCRGVPCGYNGCQWVGFGLVGCRGVIGGRKRTPRDCRRCWRQDSAWRGVEGPQAGVEGFRVW